MKTTKLSEIKEKNLKDIVSRQEKIFKNMEKIILEEKKEFAKLIANKFNLDLNELNKLLKVKSDKEVTIETSETPETSEEITEESVRGSSMIKKKLSDNETYFIDYIHKVIYLSVEGTPVKVGRVSEDGKMIISKNKKKIIKLDSKSNDKENDSKKEKAPAKK